MVIVSGPLRLPVRSDVADQVGICMVTVSGTLRLPVRSDVADQK